MNIFDIPILGAYERFFIFGQFDLKERQVLVCRPDGDKSGAAACQFAKPLWQFSAKVDSHIKGV